MNGLSCSRVRTIRRERHVTRKRGDGELKLVRVRTPRDAQTVSALAQMIAHEYLPQVIGASATASACSHVMEPEALATRMHEGYAYDFITQGGQVIGYLSYLHQPDEGELQISELCLAEGFRGSGRGTRALELLGERAQAEGLGTLAVDVVSADASARTFFESAGFSDAGSGGPFLGYDREVACRRFRRDFAAPTRLEADYLAKRLSQHAPAGHGQEAQTSDDAVSEKGEHAQRPSLPMREQEDARGTKQPVNAREDYPQIAREYAEDLGRLPRFGLGAFLLTPIWAPAHGFWIAILLYPAWVFVDSLLRQAYVEGSLFALIAGTAVCLVTVAVSAWIAVTGQRNAYVRVAGKVKLETYLRRERIWNIVSIPVAVGVVALATYYNLVIFPML